ncbi:hypothetical protein [Fusobacterium nucleatum]|uniref:hypothetical protein n=1 Tax=Fusobacterium nucleatum TaxID=851 RepID=UPI0003F730F2|nr:hypothetical protein [Fusobacterium nucleatum]
MMLEDFGMMTEPMPENAVQYDLRALDKYCAERKILPINLSEEELKKFELPKDKSVANF